VAIDDKGSNFRRDVFDGTCAGMLDHEALAQRQNAFLAEISAQSTGSTTVTATGKRMLEVDTNNNTSFKKTKEAQNQ
jgi:hypothetical protein